MSQVTHMLNTFIQYRFHLKTQTINFAPLFTFRMSCRVAVSITTTHDQLSLSRVCHRQDIDEIVLLASITMPFKRVRQFDFFFAVFFGPYDSSGYCDHSQVADRCYWVRLVFISGFGAPPEDSVPSAVSASGTECFAYAIAVSVSPPNCSIFQLVALKWLMGRGSEEEKQHETRQIDGIGGGCGGPEECASGTVFQSKVFSLLEELSSDGRGCARSPCFGGR